MRQDNPHNGRVVTGEVEPPEIKQGGKIVNFSTPDVEPPMPQSPPEPPPAED